MTIALKASHHQSGHDTITWSDRTSVYPIGAIAFARDQIAAILMAVFQCFRKGGNQHHTSLQ